jgi:hypothetical protein
MSKPRSSGLTAFDCDAYALVAAIGKAERTVVRDVLDAPSVCNFAAALDQQGIPQIGAGP